MAEAKVTITGTPEAPILNFDIPQGEKGDPGGIVQGTIIPNGANWDTYTTDGVYRVFGDSGHASTPPLAQLYGTLVVFTSQGSARILQQYHSQVSGDRGQIIYQRVLAGGIWYQWYVYVTNRVDNTAGKAIYQWDPSVGREQLVYGDTGWRKVLAGTIAGLPNLEVHARRVGYDVTVAVAEPIGGGTATGDTTLWTPTSGFRASFNGSGASTQITSSQMADESGRVISSTMFCSWFNPMAIRMYPLVGKRHYGSLSYTTTDPWPTALPGSAIGTIPNL